MGGLISRKQTEKSIVDMRQGEKSMIITIHQLDKVVRHRFIDLGIAPFAKIELIKTLHFDRLYMIEVDDVKLCIRREDAQRILVQ